MRVGTAIAAGRQRVVVQREGRWYGVEGGDSQDLVRMLGRAERSASWRPGEPLNDVQLLAPLQPRSIIGVGLNYLDHIRETGMERPSAPLLFGKLPSSVTGPHTDIVINPAVTTRADWEVELAVVIGERMRSVPAVDALAGVFGYTVANDVSARDLQLADGQWLRGKSLDTFCPLGPYIVSPGEIVDPQRLRLTTKVNGSIVQDSSTAEMLFSVGYLIAFCSRHFTLYPGDVLLTGTPWGCGEFAEPRRSLCDGDTVEVSVEDIGDLRNTVRFINPELSG